MHSFSIDFFLLIPITHLLSGYHAHAQQQFDINTSAASYNSNRIFYLLLAYILDSASLFFPKTRIFVRIHIWSRVAPDFVL